MATPTRKVGRPRNPDVIARDEQIYKLLADGPRSRSSISEETNLDRDAVYLSCQRLQRADRIGQCLINGAIVWAVNDGTPCP